MNIIPKHKKDFETCEKLAFASDADIIAVLPELLECLQDYNWPIAEKVHERLKTIGEPLVEPIKSILRSNDGAWKLFIIMCFLPAIDKSVSTQLHEELQRIVDLPTIHDIREEVVIEAKEFLTENS